MSARLLNIVQLCLMIWGALSLIGILLLVGFAAFQLGPGNRDKTDSASAHDVRYVLNWCELGDQRIEKVLHSHVSARSFTGDHLDAYAIKISHVDIEELTKKTDEFVGVGTAGTSSLQSSEMPSILRAAGFTSFHGFPPNSSFEAPISMFIRGVFIATACVRQQQNSSSSGRPITWFSSSEAKCKCRRQATGNSLSACSPAAASPAIWWTKASRPLPLRSKLDLSGLNPTQ